MFQVTTQEALFIGANRQTQVSDQHAKTHIVAFGAGQTIALWNPLDENSQGVFATLKGHEAEVTCVKFITDTPYMVSCSEDHHVKIWKQNPGVAREVDGWTCVQTLDHYSHTVVALAVLPGLIAVGCADGKVSLWVQKMKEDVFILGEEFEVQKGVLPLALAFSKVIDDKYLLAVGGTNVNVFVFSFVLNATAETIETLQLAAKLEGHEDWIKSLAFRHQETPGDYLLCSGSQDRYIRLWRIRINDLIEEQDEDDEDIATKLALLNNKQYKFHVTDALRVCINFEALIMGHDDWISSLQWHETRLQLLASTADTALMVWEPDEASGIWVCGLRLGELSSKGASTATGSAGGFWSCLWFSHQNKDYILTNGKTGSWRVWTLSLIHI